MGCFEYVAGYSEKDFPLPEKGTSDAAAYDMYAAEDIMIYSYYKAISAPEMEFSQVPALTLEEVESEVFHDKWKPTLIPLGVKCRLDAGTHLKLYSRSSTPLKYGIIQANSVGVIDRDYYNNPSNEGQMFFQVYNMSPYDIQIKKGDRICQCIVEKNIPLGEDALTGKYRVGGFGSTSSGVLK